MSACASTKHAAYVLLYFTDASMRGEGNMEESIESSCVGGETEILDPFKNFLKNVSTSDSVG